MKKLIYTTLALTSFAISMNAQVGIETDNVSVKAILDFPDEAKGGILLPYVTNPSATAGDVPGTILYNAGDGRVYHRDNANTWVPMTPAPNDTNVIASHNTAQFPEIPEAAGAEINDTGFDSSATGVLVLESNTKALALPKVDSVDNIESPTTGMICYDVSRKGLAIFNGEYWIIRN